ncbi:phospholipase D-like domain-containing protein [Celerinatantimonas diazotrophica]|uniref:Phosphatidylserine/phosphatidylglycerophosphate/ cardiolipin synthase-like enzyme n=1 Tax=Celerinatantimonas diazotrophica TaxID=412034 RepID=A0A4R1K215_9GAMM|nr:phospholipase D-like domain-containing protein [Celerinatantimonas diazotrophica]TCK57857.1 phosphatidylserine/phosphatidylglycerophosphate/cardiolipin synthase-like enzyme [Celerinatantimonas diazotrophica]CAG9298078.1 Cardiolipin synthase A [Celerinatantimonas diazotrophica]
MKQGSDFQLIYTQPIETSLLQTQVLEPVAFFCELFESAKYQIDIAQFYLNCQPQSQFGQVIDALVRASQRGVTIRILLAKQGLALSTRHTLAQLAGLRSVQIQYIDYQSISGGIMHAKYVIVDGQKATLGSHNFDWRAMCHIHELSLLICHKRIVAQLQTIFDFDWHAQHLQAQNIPILALNYHRISPGNFSRATLLASPNAYNPPTIGDSQLALVQLLDRAQTHIRIMVMKYLPLAQPSLTHRVFYPTIDDALRRAALRGVKVELLVSNWYRGESELQYVKSLAILSNITIKIITIPQPSQSFIAYARVLHSKAMSIDAKLAWIGTSNWEGGYLDFSRNVELVVPFPSLAEQIETIHQQLWHSDYAAPIDLNHRYLSVDPGADSCSI